MGRLISKRYVDKTTQLYDLEIDANHNYFANDVLVHNCSNPSSIQSSNLAKLYNYDYKIALTGTLIQNNPLSAFPSLKWVGIEKASFSNFKSQYCVFGGFGGHEIIGYKNLDMLKEQISQFSLRRKKEDLKDFPKKMVIDEYVEMNDDQSQFYDNVKQGIKESCNKIELNANNILALVTRLRQASSCPTMLSTESISSCKIERAVDLVEEICENGDKVVIMSNFKEPLNVLYNRLKEYNPLLGTGDVADDVVAKNIETFQSDTEHKVFLSTISKCGTGINLNAASYMIFIDEAFTQALNEQAQDRINRLNNTKPSFIYNLICKDTIDERVDEIVKQKKDLSDFIVDDVKNESLIKRLKNIIDDL